MWSYYGRKKKIIKSKPVYDFIKENQWTKGEFYCETFEDKEAVIYMKVYPIQQDVPTNTMEAV